MDSPRPPAPTATRHHVRIHTAKALLDASLGADDVPAGFAPLWFHTHRIGAVHPQWIQRLDPHLFGLERQAGHTHVRMQATDRRAGREPSSPDAFNHRLQGWAARLNADGQLPGWRNEVVTIFGPQADAPLFRVERALLRPLGLLLRTVQVNVFTWDASAGLQLWAARRAAHKAVDPGLLDSLVAGGMAGDETPLETLLREAAEEAGLPLSLSRRALPSGIMDSSAVEHDGVAPVLNRERMHVFDLQVPATFIPSFPDGETEEAMRLSPTQIIEQIKAGQWTREGAWACLNLIQRARAGKLRHR
ncbi:MAG: NUDIX domain-containing protein [Lautropia sp.]|nr:NUDIX domain-containing protein [Lautropia sp.]